MSKQKLVWKKKPEAEDYEGALNFLLLIYPDAKARRLLRLFRKTKTVEHAAKDLLRADSLPPGERLGAGTGGIRLGSTQ